MKLLTDCPQRLTGWAPAMTPASPAGLTDLEQAAWRVLGGENRLFTCTMPGPCPALVVVGNAPRSQFEVLVHALQRGIRLPHGMAAVALEGRGFKGQRGRSWMALDGNLHLCVTYRLGIDAARLGMGLTVLPAIAVTAAIRRVTGGGLRPGIKWVNDVFVDGRKVSGVLTTTQASGHTLEQVTFGIGVNVAVAPPAPPTPFVPATGCLGQGLAWHHVLGPLLEEIDSALSRALAEGPGPLVDAYRSDSVVLGRRVRIWPEGTRDADVTAPVAEGVVTGIDDDLALRLQGVADPIRAGRLALVC